jgi:hypothetical protein
LAGGKPDGQDALMRLKPFAVIPVVLVVAAVVACGGSGDDAAVETSTVATVEVAPASTAAPDITEAPFAIGEWTSIRPDDCECSDGSPFELWQRPADPTKVLLYLEGGGACFSAETCSPASPIFTKNLDLGQEPGGNGIFDADNPENPFADYSIVYVPYCTGDAHLGDRINEYTDTLTISHTGFDNASSGLETVIADYPDVEHLVVAGSSAGSIPVPTFAGVAADALPDAEIVAFGDASGAYPDLPELNARVGSEWGVLANVPDWPANEGLTAEQYSFPGLYVQAGTEHPDITFARFDNAFDGVQTFFSGLLDVDVSDLLGMIDATEDQIEAAGVPIASFIAPGGGHTILGSNELYDLEVEEVRLVDFLRALVDGDVPDDVRCTVCS